MLTNAVAISIAPLVDKAFRSDDTIPSGIEMGNYLVMIRYLASHWLEETPKSSRVTAPPATFSDKSKTSTRQTRSQTSKSGSVASASKRKDERPTQGPAPTKRRKGSSRPRDTQEEEPGVSALDGTRTLHLLYAHGYYLIFRITQTVKQGAVTQQLFQSSRTAALMKMVLPSNCLSPFRSSVCGSMTTRMPRILFQMTTATVVPLLACSPCRCHCLLYTLATCPALNISKFNSGRANAATKSTTQ
jgi:hypothetical protein